MIPMDSNDFHDFLNMSEWSLWASPVRENAKSLSIYNDSLDFRRKNAKSL